MNKNLYFAVTSQVLVSRVNCSTKSNGNFGSHSHYHNTNAECTLYSLRKRLKISPEVVKNLSAILSNTFTTSERILTAEKDGYYHLYDFSRSECQTAVDTVCHFTNTS